MTVDDKVNPVLALGVGKEIIHEVIDRALMEYNIDSYTRKQK
jgi:hypothetical protein